MLQVLKPSNKLEIDKLLTRPSDPGASLADSEFLQAAVECIVLPLQDELYQFLGKPGP